MRVRHPHALSDDGPEPDDAVHYGGRREIAPVDEDGTFEIPDDRTSWLEGWAASYDADVEDLIVDGEEEQIDSSTTMVSSSTSDDVTIDTSPDDTEESGTCTAIKADGEVCGRDLPCRYHSEGE